MHVHVEFLVSVLLMGSRTIVLELDSKFVTVGFSGEFVPRYSTSAAAIHSGSNADCVELLKYLFLDILQVKSRDFSVLVVEDLFLRQATLDALVVLLFRDFQVAAVAVQSCMCMSQVASAMSSGVVVHLGDSESHVMCFAEGRPLMHSLRCTLHPTAARLALTADRLVACSIFADRS